MSKIKTLALVMGLLCSVGITLFAVAVLGIFIYLSSNSIFYFPGAVFLVTIVSLFTGGVVSGNKAGIGGWFHGGVTGLAYVFLFLLIQIKLFPELFSFVDILAQSLLLPLIASIGGIIGVNMPQVSSGVTNLSQQYNQ